MTDEIDVELCGYEWPGMSSVKKGGGMHPCAREKGHAGDHLWWTAVLINNTHTSLWIYEPNPEREGGGRVRIHADLKGSELLTADDVYIYLVLFDKDTRDAAIAKED